MSDINRAVIAKHQRQGGAASSRIDAVMLFLDKAVTPMWTVLFGGAVLMVTALLAMRSHPAFSMWVCALLSWYVAGALLLVVLSSKAKARADADARALAASDARLLEIRRNIKANNEELEKNTAELQKLADEVRARAATPAAPAAKGGGEPVASEVGAREERERAQALLAALRRVEAEASADEVEPDDCREAILRIVREAIGQHRAGRDRSSRT